MPGRVRNRSCVRRPSRPRSKPRGGRFPGPTPEGDRAGRTRKGCLCRALGGRHSKQGLRARMVYQGSPEPERAWQRPKQCIPAPPALAVGRFRAISPRRAHSTSGLCQPDHRLHPLPPRTVDRPRHPLLLRPNPTTTRTLHASSVHPPRRQHRPASRRSPTLGEPAVRGRRSAPAPAAAQRRLWSQQRAHPGGALAGGRDAIASSGRRPPDARQRPTGTRNGTRAEFTHQWIAPRIRCASGAGDERAGEHGPPPMRRGENRVGSDRTRAVLS